MPLTVVDTPQSGFLKIHIVGDATAAGLLDEIANPEGVDVYVIEAHLYVVTPATAAGCTANVGFAATGVSNGALLSVMDVNAPGAGTMWSACGRAAAEAAETGTQTGALWAAANFLTWTTGVAASTGLDAYLYVRYIRLDD